MSFVIIPNKTYIHYEIFTLFFALEYNKLRYAVKQKKRYYLGIFPNMGGGVFPNPKTFVNLPSIFLYAKLGPKWPQMVKNMLY